MKDRPFCVGVPHKVRPRRHGFYPIVDHVDFVAGFCQQLADDRLIDVIVLCNENPQLARLGMRLGKFRWHRPEILGDSCDIARLAEDREPESRTRS